MGQTSRRPESQTMLESSVGEKIFFIALTNAWHQISIKPHVRIKPHVEYGPQGPERKGPREKGVGYLGDRGVDVEHV